MTDFVDPLDAMAPQDPQPQAAPAPAQKPVTREARLLEKLLAWDGRDPALRDEIRARIWCLHKDVFFDSIVGRIEDGVDRRRVLYSEDGDPFKGISVDMAAIDIWPAAIYQPSRWARLWAKIRGKA